jgi:hypothetical protein
MKRTKEWWEALTGDERSHLVYIEKHANGGMNYGGGGYLPYDVGECPVCGQLSRYGLCDYCAASQKKYIDKANKAVRNDTE